MYTQHLQAYWQIGSMMNDSIFLRADTRAANEQVAGRCYTHTAGEALQACDIFIDPAREWSLVAETGMQHFFLPVVGDVVMCGIGWDKHCLGIGDVLYVAQDSVAELKILNPYKEDVVNIVHLKIKGDSNTRLNETQEHIAIVEKNKILYTEELQPTTRLGVGVYDSRKKDQIFLSAPMKHLWAMTLNGTFEIEGRLLEYRDGLLFTATHEVELEALTEAAIILTLQF